jgi:hypothetical protein
MRRLDIVIESFLDAVTGSGLFGWVRSPGAPTHLIDPRGLEEYKASGDYAATLARFGLAERVEQSPNATAPR